MAIEGGIFVQISRLFQIVHILLNKEQITAKELADKFEVSTRTIYRDIDTLSMAGIPIYTNKGKGGGISILDNFIMNKTVLSDTEQNNLLMGLETLRATQFGDVDEAIKKLRNLFNKSDDNWIEVDFSNWESSDKEKDKFEILKDALINNKVIEFEYYTPYGEKTAREVHPVKLVFKSKAWYLQGYCKLRNNMRVFKVHRIRNLNILNERFNKSPYDPIDMNGVFTECDNAINLKFRLSPKVTFRAYDEFHEDNMTKNDDGSFTINLKVAEDEWLYGYIISFGEHIEIIEPEYIKDIIKDKLKRILKSYE